MTFKPCQENHAILEVAFVITLDRFIDEPVFRSLADDHSTWKEELPIREELMAPAIAVGSSQHGSSPQFRAGLGGVCFKSVKRDGTLDWMLQVRDDKIIVNCGSYTRWMSIYPTVQRYMSRITDRDDLSSASVYSVALQYIDEFVWHGELNEYDVFELIDRDSDYITPRLNNHGALWHLHQGWFINESLCVGGRRLEKVNLDAVERGGEYVVRMDTMLRHDLHDQVPLPGQLLSNREGLVDNIFSELHEVNKNILRSVLTDSLAEEIKLNAPDETN